MSPVIDDAGSWAEDGSRVAIAMVVDVRKSAPRPRGTKMAIGEDGQISGAVSGGCVEGAVVEVASEVMEQGEPRLLSYGITDEEAWEVGLQCGGEIDVWVEPYRRGDDDLSNAFAELQANDERGALVTVMKGEPLGAKMLVLPDGTRRGTLGDAALDDRAAALADEEMWGEGSRLREDGDHAFFFDVNAPASRLFIFGAVDYAASLCTLAKFMGWRPFVIDPRTFFAQESRFPDAEQVVADWPEPAFEKLGGIDRATAVVVLTHDPKLDDAALHAALSSEAPYIGAMGSRNAQAARRERLLEGGIEESQLERISAPVGLDLGSVTAEETALSIMGEIIALRRGRSGGRLQDSKKRIHSVTS